MMIEFVDVHFDDGCAIGRKINETESTIDVAFDNCIITDIPKSRITDWVKSCI